MKITAIIAEYNPFHNGHAYQIEQIRRQSEDTCILALMSGNFVQHGEPAVFNKFFRARLALLGGADIVLELPAGFSLQSASGFASGAVRILNALHCVDTLNFGSECGNLDVLQSAAEKIVLQETEWNTAVRSALLSGVSYQQAAVQALQQFAPGADLAQSNNLLALEYLIALLRTKSNIRPETVYRKSSGFNDTIISGPFASATAIRSALSAGNTEQLSVSVPRAVFQAINEYLQTENPVFLADYYEYILYALRCHTPQTLQKIQSVSEGYEHRILQCAKTAASFEEFLDSLMTKRYSKRRIQRILASVLLQITHEEIKSYNTDRHLYARVLGFRKTSKRALALIAQNTSIPLYTRVSGFDRKNPLLAKEIFASGIYALGQKNRAANMDLTHQMIIL